MSLYTPAELAQMNAQAEALGWTFDRWIEHFEGICLDHAAIYITRPDARHQSLARLPVDERVILLRILDVLDEIIAAPDTTHAIVDRIHQRANVAIALADFEQGEPL